MSGILRIEKNGLRIPQKGGQAYGRAPSVMMKKSSLRNGMSLTYAPFLVLLITSLGTKHPYDLFGLTG